jgi:hypothetical protein
MAQQSARRGWENQGFPQCFKHALGDLDLARELPYRPAADYRCITGRTDGSIRLRANTILKVFPCQEGVFSNRASFVNSLFLPFVAAPGSRFSPRSEGSAATSGTKHRRCNVHNGLACIVCGPRPTCAAACTLAPSGNRHIRGDAPDGSRRDSSGGYWLLGPAEWLARAPDAVHDHGEFPSKRYARLACT